MRKNRIQILEFANQRETDRIVLGVRREKGVPGAATHLPIATAHNEWRTESQRSRRLVGRRHFEGTTGWSIGYGEDPERRDIEIASLYDKLEGVILPLYYSNPEGYASVMRSTIAVNGSFFNTQRMVAQYVSNAYYPRTNLSPESTVRDGVKLESPVPNKV
jgi:hypothetical protein